MKPTSLSDLANRISVSVLRRHGAVRYVMAVLVAAVALAGTAFGAYALATEPLALIGSSGYALPDDAASSDLADLAATGGGLPDIEPVAFAPGDALWSGMGGLSVGSRRTRIAEAYPLFVNDGAAVQTVTGEGSLVLDTYEELEATAGLIVSEGRAYTEVGEVADHARYRFLKVRGGAYVLLEQLHLRAEGVDEVLPGGSIAHFGESAVAFYRYGEGVLRADRVTVLPQAATVSFGIDGDDEISYDELLRRLGLLGEEAGGADAEPEASDEAAASDDAEDAAGERDGAGVSVQHVDPTDPDAQAAPAADAPGEDADADADQGAADAPADDLDADAPGDGDPGAGEPGTWTWVKPEASSDPLVPSVYQATGNLAINDPAGVISRPVRFEFRRGGELYLRANYTAGGAITVQGLAPNTTYDVSAHLTYRNRAGKEVEETFFEQRLTTGDASSLEAMRISFAQGQLQPERLELAEITFTGGSRELLANATGLAFEIDGKSFAVSAALRSRMLAGEQVSLTTSASFKPNSSYEVRLAATDRYGNVLALQAPARTMRTCKAAPVARLRVEGNDATQLTLGVDVNDAHGAIAGTAHLELTDDAGALIERKELEAGNHTYEFGELGYDRVLHARVVCTYDLADGQGAHADAVIGEMDFTTVSVSTLGYAVFATTVSDVTDSSAALSVALNTKQMDARLVALLTDGSVSAGLPGREPAFTHAFTADEMARLRAGEKLTFRMSGLESMKTYELSTTAGVQVGDEQTGRHHEVKTTNKPTTFQTMRRAAQVQFANTAVMNSSIVFDVRVLDIDHAVNKDVMLEVRDAGGRLMGDQLHFDAVDRADGDGWQRECRYENLAPDAPYTINVVAYDYNLGLDDTTLEGRAVLYTGVIKTVDGVSGEITLRGVDKVEGNKNALDVRARVEIADLWGELAPRQFSVEVLRDGELVDTLTHAFAAERETIELDPYRIARERATYTLRLVVTHHGQRIELSETSFSAEHPLVGISTEDELKRLPKADPDGHFIVLNDIETTANYITGGNGAPFTGSLDVQGYTLTLKNKSQNPAAPLRYALFYDVGKGGVVKNAVIEVEGTPAGSIAEVCSGTIQNVVVHVKPYEHAKYSRFGGIAGTVSEGGVIENFAVDLGGDVVASTNSGGAAGVSYGTIRGGYVYGGRLVLPADCPPETIIQQVGGIVGVSGNQSAVSSAISMVDVVAQPTRRAKSIGLAVGGGSTATLSGVLACGELSGYYDNASNSQDVGPVVGSSPSTIAGRQKNIYRLGAAPLGAVDGSVRVSALALYDHAWYEGNLDRAGALDLSPVLRECYPQAVMPASMRGAQPFVGLPARPEVHVPTITSIKVLERAGDSATVQVSLSNPDYYPIRGIDVDGAFCSIVGEPEKDPDDPTITRVKMRITVSDTRDYKSGYSIVGMSYELYRDHIETEVYKVGEHVIDVEFFRPIGSVAEWKQLKDSSQNFRLTADLDFSGHPDSDIGLGTFKGKLDGEGHTISGIELKSLPAVMSLRGGTVMDLTVDGLSIRQRRGGYGTVAFISAASAGALVDGVCVRDARIEVFGEGAAIAGNVTDSTIVNCSVIDTELVMVDAASVGASLGGSARIGGIATYLGASTISNSFTQDVSIDASAADGQIGVGGIVGTMSGTGTIKQSYAVGSISAAQLGTGGVVGVSSGSGDKILGVWSDVDIVSSAGRIGGIAGALNGSAYTSLSALAVGDVRATSVAQRELGRVFGYAGKPEGVTGLSYFEGQQAEGATNTGGSALTTAQLRQPATYTDALGMTEFELGEVSGGMLPKVRATDGSLLPGQRDNYLERSASVRVTDVTARIEGSSHTVQIEVEHEAGDAIEGVSFDWLEPKGAPRILPSGDTHTTVLYSDVTPTRFYDTYRVEAISYTRDGKRREDAANARLYFGKPLYRTIGSLRDWKSIERGTYENYQIVADLDFTGLDYTSGNMGVKVGRLEGVQVKDPATGALRNPVISGLDVTIDAKKGGYSLIDTVRTSVGHLTFSDISIASDGSAEASPGPSIIKMMLGSDASAAGGDAYAQGGMFDVAFKDIALTAAPTPGGTRSGTYMGAIGILGGDVRDVTAEGVTVHAQGDKVTAGNYFGAVFGHGRTGSAVEDVDVRDVSIDCAVGFAGGVGGKLDGSGTGIEASDVRVTSHNSTGNMYVGGAFGYATKLQDVRVTGTRSIDGSTTVVSTKGNFAGGIVGQGPVTDGHVEGVVVRGVSRVGGIAGDGAVDGATIATFDAASASTVHDCLIESVNPGASQYVGGVSGSAGMVRNALVTQTTVRGGSYVGGVVGSLSNSVSNCIVQDCDIEGAGDCVGGVAGYRTIFNAGSSGTSVRGRSKVGGVVGEGLQVSRSFATDSSTRPTTVVGSDMVGGIAGTFNGRYDNAELLSDATVVAQAGTAGGIVGVMQPAYAAGSSNAGIGHAVSTGTVTASGPAGGIAGTVTSGVTPSLMRGMMVSATVMSDAGKGSAVIGANATAGVSGADTLGPVLVHNATTVDGVRVTRDGLPSMLGAGASMAEVVSATDITTDANAARRYTNKPTDTPGGLQFAVTYWDIADCVAAGCFPQVKFTGGAGVASPYQARISVPDAGEVAALATQDAAADAPAAPALADMGDVAVYASGVNTFNVEFAPEALGCTFEVVPAQGAGDGADGTDGADGAADAASAGGDAAADAADVPKDGAADETAPAPIGGVVQRRVYTFAWDFSTPLDVVVHAADGARIYRVDASELARQAAVWADEVYWIAEDGVHALDGVTVEGAFVHLYDGMALASDGSIAHVAGVEGARAAAPLEAGVAVQSVAEAVPLAAGEGWRTFWTFTELDGGAARDVRLYPVDEELYGVSGEFDTVADGYVFADVDGARYRTVLLADGTLFDLADPLVCPHGFERAGIASMTNTAAATVPLVAVRYEDGTMVCFDYTTGEVRFSKQGNGEDLSLLDYAGGFLDGLFAGGDDADVPAGDNGYGDALAFEEDASRGGLAGLDAGGAGDAGAGDGGSGDGDGAADGAGPSVAGGGDAGADNGAPAGSSSGGSAAAAGGFASGGGYVSVFEPSRQGYVTYAQDELLDGARADVMSLHEAHGIPASGGTAVPVTTQAPAAPGAGSMDTAGHVALFSSVVLGVCAILLFI